MNLELDNFENRMQESVCYIPWWWQVVHVIPELVVNSFFKGAHPYLQHICRFQQLCNNINNINSVWLFIKLLFNHLSLILLTWRIWWAPNNASRWQMGFNSEFKMLKNFDTLGKKTCKPTEWVGWVVLCSCVQDGVNIYHWHIAQRDGSYQKKTFTLSENRRIVWNRN
jgi:hypothetical protein